MYTRYKLFLFFLAAVSYGCQKEEKKGPPQPASAADLESITTSVKEVASATKRLAGTVGELKTSVGALTGSVETLDKRVSKLEASAASAATTTAPPGTTTAAAPPAPDARGGGTLTVTTPPQPRRYGKSPWMKRVEDRLEELDDGHIAQSSRLEELEAGKLLNRQRITALEAADRVHETRLAADEAIIVVALRGDDELKKARSSEPTCRWTVGTAAWRACVAAVNAARQGR